MLSKLTPEAGKILISEPFMLDPNFRRSVVFLVEHGEDGTVGFVLNQATELSVSDVMERFPFFDSKLYLGGPVETDTLHYIHTLGDVLEGSRLISNSIYWGGDFDTLKTMINEGIAKPEAVRFFLGYSGWSPGQLDEELQQNSWIVSNANSERIFDDQYKDFWKDTIRELGNKYAHIANFPENPMWN